MARDRRAKRATIRSMKHKVTIIDTDFPAGRKSGTMLTSEAIDGPSKVRRGRE